TVDRMKRVWKRLDKLKVGDKLAVTPGFPCTITAPVDTGWTALLRHFGPKSKAKIPSKLNAETAGLLGYVLGDGWVDKYAVSFDVNSEEQDLVLLLCGIAERNFGITPSIQISKRKGKKPITVVELNNVGVASNLQFLRKKRVPDLVFRSGNKVAAEFLSWLFEADGCVFSKGRGKRAVQLKSSEMELLRDVQMLLLRFGIHSRIVSNNLTIRRAEAISKFSKFIGFKSVKKKTRMAELVGACEKLPHKFGRQWTERIVSVKPAGFADVFDIEVPEGNRFIANGVVSHNTGKSQLLKYTEMLAPKCIYVAGRGASGVGLTASAEKDKAGEGWVLKAGALVLASGGLVAIDEFDKMDVQDRANIHEALEQQQISIAKAGIVTRFKAKTSVLAAANPKFGRFDSNQTVPEQFDIPPTLLSRFDLIFPIQDIIEEGEDRKTAVHILQGLTYASKKKAGVADLEDIKPPLSNDLLRKYIAFARRNCVPQLSEEARDRIKEYYLDLRNLGKTTKSYPITARDLEGLVRLAEAAAKMRLSNTVELQDAELAISLKDFVLRMVFRDKTTGQFDVDIIATGISKVKRDRIFTILNIVGELEKEFDLVSFAEVLKQAAVHGLSEQDAVKILQELTSKGDLYTPKAGFVKKAHKQYG
ncbi:MAG: LAGLIDADG family homing endonuclease, partial [Candidatus Micrarchaeota archaeon]